MTHLDDLKKPTYDLKRGLDLFYISQSTPLNRLHNSLNNELLSTQERQPEIFSEMDIQTLISDTIEPPIYVKGLHSGLYYGGNRWLSSKQKRLKGLSLLNIFLDWIAAQCSLCL